MVHAHGVVHKHERAQTQAHLSHKVLLGTPSTIPSPTCHDQPPASTSPHTISHTRHNQDRRRHRHTPRSRRRTVQRRCDVCSVAPPREPLPQYKVKRRLSTDGAPRHHTRSAVQRTRSRTLVLCGRRTRSAHSSGHRAWPSDRRRPPMAEITVEFTAESTHETPRRSSAWVVTTAPRTIVYKGVHTLTTHQRSIFGTTPERFSFHTALHTCDALNAHVCEHTMRILSMRSSHGSSSSSRHPPLPKPLPRRVSRKHAWPRATRRSRRR